MEELTHDLDQRAQETWGRDAVSGIAAHRDGLAQVAYEDTPDWSERATDLPSAFEVMADAVRRVIGSRDDLGAPRICRVALTPPDYPVQVVKIIVPGLEEFHQGVWRMGRRLRDYARTLKTA